MKKSFKNTLTLTTLIATVLVGTVTIASFLNTNTHSNYDNSVNLSNQNKDQTLSRNESRTLLNKNYKFSVEDQSTTLFRLAENTQLFDYNSIAIDPQSTYRSEVNPYGYTLSADSDYQPLANPYTNLFYANEKIKNGQAPDANIFYYALLSIVGPGRFLDYIQYDKTHSNSNASWTAMSEIKNISSYYGLNFYPMLKAWKNKFYMQTSPFDFTEKNRPRHIWPGRMEDATDDEKRIISSISNLTAPEFVGNLYATGIYTAKSNDPYDFNSYEDDKDDLQAPISLPIDRSHTFDFDKYIVSANDNFQWDNLQVTNLNLNGGNLKVDGRKVIYTPSLKNVNTIDSFDVSIRNTTHYSDSSVRMQKIFKWKIKIKKVFDKPIFSLYSPWSNNYRIGLSNSEIINLASSLRQKTPICQWVNDNFNQFNPKNQKQAMRVQFKFVAPFSGYYTFTSSFDDLLNVVVTKQGQSGTFISRTFNKWTSQQIVLNKGNASDYLNAGDTLIFDIVVINTGGIGNFDFSILYREHVTWAEEDRTDQFMDSAILLPHVNIKKSNNSLRSATVNKIAKSWKYINIKNVREVPWAVGAKFSKYRLPSGSQWSSDNKTQIRNNVEELKRMKPNSQWISNNFDWPSIDANSAYRVQFTFVAPKSGYYKFLSIFDDYLYSNQMRVGFNDYKVVLNHWTDSWQNISPETWYAECKGDFVNYDIFIINIGGPGNFHLKMQYNHSLTNEDLDNWPDWLNQFTDIQDFENSMYTQKMYL